LAYSGKKGAPLKGRKGRPLCVEKKRGKRGPEKV